MDEMEVLEALGHVVAVTNGWEDASTLDEYVHHLVDLDSPAALKAACISIARGWDQLIRPSIHVILESYDRELVFHTTAIEPARVHCDGSGNIMVDEDDGHRWGRPCPRCCPARAAIIRDVDKAEQYLHGTAIEHLSVDVERVSNRLRYRHGYRPPRCQPAQDRPEDLRRGDAGHEIAAAAYLEAFPGRTRRDFDLRIGAVGRDIERRAVYA